MRFGLFLCVLSLATSSEARIGENAIQCANRYGAPRDTPSSKTIDRNSPLVKGAIHHTYEYEGWKIRAAFLNLNGPAIRMDFQKMSGSANGITIQNCEFEAIKTVNTPLGMKWSPMAYDNADSSNTGLAKSGENFTAVNQKMWRRSDGAILWLRSNLIVSLRLSAARAHGKQLKISKDQRVQASVPQF
jgi:hypothetical protein